MHLHNQTETTRPKPHRSTPTGWQTGTRAAATNQAPSTRNDQLYPCARPDGNQLRRPTLFPRAPPLLQQQQPALVDNNTKAPALALCLKKRQDSSRDRTTSSPLWPETKPTRSGISTAKQTLHLTSHEISLQSAPHGPKTLVGDDPLSVPRLTNINRTRPHTTGCDVEISGEMR